MGHGERDGVCNSDSGPKKPPSGLTKNELLVWHTLLEKNEPLKAYEILDLLKAKGVRAPMTVYRALDGLEHKGVVHKLEGMNAFVVCNHDGPHQVQVFTVCDSCSAVSENEIEGLETLIRLHVAQSAFDMNKARIELRGLCSDCRDVRYKERATASNAVRQRVKQPVS